MIAIIDKRLPSSLFDKYFSGAGAASFVVIDIYKHGSVVLSCVAFPHRRKGNGAVNDVAAFRGAIFSIFEVDKTERFVFFSNRNSSTSVDFVETIVKKKYEEKLFGKIDTARTISKGVFDLFLDLYYCSIKETQQ